MMSFPALCCNPSWGGARPMRSLPLHRTSRGKLRNLRGTKSQEQLLLAASGRHGSCGCTDEGACAAATLPSHPTAQQLPLKPWVTFVVDRPFHSAPVCVDSRCATLDRHLQLVDKVSGWPQHLLLSRSPISFPDYKFNECSMSGYERKNYRRSVHHFLSIAPLNPTEQIGERPDK